MKKEYKLFFNKSRLLSLLIIPLFFVSCDKDLIQYQGSEGVYFAVQYGAWNGTEANWPYYNYSTVPFFKVSASDTTILLKVMVTGRLYDYDRKFSVAINPDSTTAILDTHYKSIPTSLVIPANANFTHIPVTVIRTADLKTSAKKIGLRLVPGEQLTVTFPEWDAIPSYASMSDPIVKQYDAGLHTVVLNDWMVKPVAWSGAVAANKLETGNWGEFSEEKMLLMCQVMNFTYNDFDDKEAMPTALVNLVTREVARYLQDKFNAGQPVLEKDGRLMYVSGVTWTSYVGIPWK